MKLFNWRVCILVCVLFCGYVGAAVLRNRDVNKRGGFFRTGLLKNSDHLKICVFIVFIPIEKVE
jgi:hypothetical protein